MIHLHIHCVCIHNKNNGNTLLRASVRLDAVLSEPTRYRPNNVCSLSRKYLSQSPQRGIPSTPLVPFEADKTYRRARARPPLAMVGVALAPAVSRVSFQPGTALHALGLSSSVRFQTMPYMCFNCFQTYICFKCFIWMLQKYI